MSEPQDIPVVCTRSGVIMLLEAVIIPKEIPRPYDVADVRTHFFKVGAAARISGRVCPGCRFESSYSIVAETGQRVCNKETCEYRPLVGPLFVPR